MSEAKRILGIDVSEFNGRLDWPRLKEAGVGFAIIRSGYGVSYEDPRFRENVEGCIACGIPFGVYHFSYALSPKGAEKEAEFCLRLLEPYKNQRTLPVFYDLEYDTVRYAEAQGVHLGREECSANIRAFCGWIFAHNTDARVYFNPDYKARMLTPEVLKWNDNWFACWDSDVDWSAYHIWQFTSSLTLPGHSCRFDGNYCREDYLRQYLDPDFSFEPDEPNPETGDSINPNAPTVQRPYFNGSTPEPVYADTGLTARVGSLNPYEECQCLGEVDGRYLVQYRVDGTSATKVGFVEFCG